MVDLEPAVFREVFEDSPADKAGIEASDVVLKFDGKAVETSSELPRLVAAVKPGKRVLVDRNDDGKNDEAWYIDTAYRHNDRVRPLLVRAIDEDGDLDSWKGPDLDSDLYVVDWKADGTVDVVLDYQDNDGDNDVDLTDCATFQSCFNGPNRPPACS